jgi:cyclohexyl-isocyanide hydratase
MKIAFIVYDDLTLLDFSGTYDPITRLKSMGFVNDLVYDVCSLKHKVKAFEGVDIVPNKVNNDLSEYDYIFIPGGNGVLKLLSDNEFISWIKNISKDTIITAVCGGSLVLGAAGFLNAKSATTHPTLLKYLSKFTENVSQDRIVEDGNLITARGVTSAIDYHIKLAAVLLQRICHVQQYERRQAEGDNRSRYNQMPAQIGGVQDQQNGVRFLCLNQFIRFDDDIPDCLRGGIPCGTKKNIRFSDTHAGKKNLI